MSTNMASNLSTEDKAAKLDKMAANAAVQKAKNQAMTLRAIEGATAIVGYTALEALEEWKPELFTYQIPRVVAAVGGLGIFMFAGKADWLREVGAGVAMAGILPLAGLGAKKAVAALQAA